MNNQNKFKKVDKNERNSANGDSNNRNNVNVAASGVETNDTPISQASYQYRM